MELREKWEVGAEKRTGGGCAIAAHCKAGIFNVFKLLGTLFLHLRRNLNDEYLAGKEIPDYDTER